MPIFMCVISFIPCNFENNVVNYTKLAAKPKNFSTRISSLKIYFKGTIIYIIVNLVVMKLFIYILKKNMSLIANEKYLILKKKKEKK